MGRTKPPASVQSLLFEADRWTPGEARRWAVAHGHRPIYVGRPTGAGRYVRVRVDEPRPGWRKRTRTFSASEGIKAVLQWPVDDPGDLVDLHISWAAVVVDD